MKRLSTLLIALTLTATAALADLPGYRVDDQGRPAPTWTWDGGDDQGSNLSEQDLAP